MKKTLLITLLLIPFLGMAQKTTRPIEGALGIKFGSSIDDVKAAIAAKGGQINTGQSTSDNIVFSNVKLGDRVVALAAVQLLNNKVFAMGFVFKPDVDGKTLDYYFGLVNDINASYGTGKLSTKFKEPYSDKDDDGAKIVAIQNGDADYLTIWKSDNKNSIQATIRTDLTVQLAYYDQDLYDQAQKAKTEKQKTDY